MEHFNPVGWFEIPVEDLDRAEQFYQTVLETKLERQEEMDGMTMSWFPMGEDWKGAAGSLVESDRHQSSDDKTGVVVYLTTPNLEAALDRVTDAGGDILIPKKNIGEYGYIAWISDTEGNTVGLHSRNG